MKVMYIFMNFCLSCIIFLTAWMAAILGMAILYYSFKITDIIVWQIEIPFYAIISIIVAAGFYDEQIRQTPVNSKYIVQRCLSFIDL